MNFKSLLLACAALIAISANSQNRIYFFDQIQTRNSLQQWEPLQKVSERTACFSEKTIDLKLNQVYHLNIIKTTHLPDNGMIYLCRDESQQEITVMLIANEKMFLYNDKMRYLINFSAPVVLQSTHKLYAAAD